MLGELGDGLDEGVLDPVGLDLGVEEGVVGVVPVGGAEDLAGVDTS